MSRRAFLFVAISIAVAALAPVAANLVVGGRLFEETVVKDPYEAGLRYRRPADSHRVAPGVDCDLDRGPCRKEGPDGLVVELEAGPRPLRAMADLQFTVRARRGAIPLGDHQAELALAMPGMYMGENRVRMAALGDGSYSGRGVIVRCPTGGRVWTAEVALRPRAPATAAPLLASFTFEVAR